MSELQYSKGMCLLITEFKSEQIILNSIISGITLQSPLVLGLLAFSLCFLNYTIYMNHKYEEEETFFIVVKGEVRSTFILFFWYFILYNMKILSTYISSSKLFCSP